MDGHGNLLDLGCGTGELVIPLAKYFEKVLAMDPDYEMLMLGRKKAAKMHVININWQKGSSKTLINIRGAYKLTTMGQSFHWMDEKAVLKQIYNLLEPGDGVVIAGTAPIAQNKLSTQKHLIIKEMIKKYLGKQRRAGAKLYKSNGRNWENELFPELAFANLEKYDYVVKISRNIDQVVGNLFSMSFASKKLLGNDLENFQDE